MNTTHINCSMLYARSSLTAHHPVIINAMVNIRVVNGRLDTIPNIVNMNRIRRTYFNKRPKPFARSVARHIAYGDVHKLLVFVCVYGLCVLWITYHIAFGLVFVCLNL